MKQPGLRSRRSKFSGFWPLSKNRPPTKQNHARAIARANFLTVLSRHRPARAHAGMTSRCVPVRNHRSRARLQSRGTGGCVRVRPRMVGVRGSKLLSEDLSMLTVRALELVQPRLPAPNLCRVALSLRGGTSGNSRTSRANRRRWLWLPTAGRQHQEPVMNVSSQAKSQTPGPWLSSCLGERTDPGHGNVGLLYEA